MPAPSSTSTAPASGSFCRNSWACRIARAISARWRAIGRPARARCSSNSTWRGPVEQDLSAQVGAPVARGQIVEVGNLAGGSCRYARHLVSLLPRFLLDHGYTWVVFTATSVVRDILTSVGASLRGAGARRTPPPGRRRRRLGPLLPERPAGHGRAPAFRPAPVERAAATGADACVPVRNGSGPRRPPGTSRWRARDQLRRAAGTGGGRGRLAGGLRRRAALHCWPTTAAPGH